MRIGIVIPTRGTHSNLPTLVEEIAGDEGLAGAALIIVINGDHPDSSLVSSLKSFANENSSKNLGGIEVIAIPELSKTLALNAGEDRLEGSDAFLYLDDDIKLLKGRISDLVHPMIEAGDRPVLTGAARDVDPDGGRLERFFGGCIQRTPWVQSDVCQGGAFATNAAGRTRWGAFPIVSCDDWFVFSRFHPDERIVADCVVSHAYPSRLGPLLSQQDRWREARRQLENGGHLGPYSSSIRRSKDLVSLLGRPKVVLGLVVVRVIRISARILGVVRFNVHGGWGQD